MIDTSADTIAAPTDRPSPAEMREHDAAAAMLADAFQFAGNPKSPRHLAFTVMAAAVESLSIRALSPNSVRLKVPQKDAIIAGLRSAQTALWVLLPESMDRADLQINIRACGALVLHWASRTPQRRARTEYLADAGDIAAVFQCELASTVLLERLHARAAARSSKREAAFGQLLRADAQDEGGR